jgi:Domain of unknown function (DUF4429)/Short C-terminal domain
MNVEGVNGTIQFDGNTINITREGILARATFGKGSKVIPIGQIAAVQLKPAGLTRGFIQFTIAGGNEKTSRLGKQAVDAAKDENSVLFTKGSSAEFEALRDAIDVAIAARFAAPLPSPVVASQPSMTDELSKLADLHRQGILTDIEFATAKAKLVNG